MKFRARIFASALAVVCLCCFVPAVLAEPARKLAGVPFVQERIYAPTDLVNLRKQLHRRVVLEGVIVAAGKSRTGATSYLNFTKNYRESVALVFLGGSKDEFPQEKLAEFVGKKIHVGGLLDEFNGALQVRVFELAHMKVLKGP